jgi:ubiquinone/menaquinone biosynthesis C-methylase UbiE
MKDASEFWKEWFDDCAKHATSDYAMNRGTTVRVAALEQRAERQFLDVVVPKATDVVLDAGCGSGRNVSLLSARVQEIVALDFAPEMLHRLNERIDTERLTNVKVMLGSVTKLPFADDAFDTVICTSVLQYLNDSDCEAAFREMFRVCKDGGRIIVHLKNGSSLYGLSKFFANKALAFAGRRGLPEYYRSWATHGRMIAGSGGSIVDLDSFGLLTFVGLPKTVVRWVLPLEMRLPRGAWLRRFGVNCKLAIKVAKRSAASDVSR